MAPGPVHDSDGDSLSTAPGRRSAPVPRPGGGSLAQSESVRVGDLDSPEPAAAAAEIRVWVEPGSRQSHRRSETPSPTAKWPGRPPSPAALAAGPLAVAINAVT